MDVNSLNKILLFSHQKDISTDLSNIKSNFLKFLKKNNECSPILLEYFLYSLFYFKLNQDIYWNKDIILIEENYFDNEIKDNINIKELLSNKIIFVPYFEKTNNIFGLILILNYYKSEEQPIIKIFSPNKIIQNIETFLKHIIQKFNINIEKEGIKNKIEKVYFDDKYNSSKIIINLIDELSVIESEKINNYISKNFKNEEKENIIELLNSKNKLFEKIEKEYDKLIQEFMKYKNLLIKEENIFENNKNNSSSKKGNSKRESLSIEEESLSENNNIIKEEDDKLNINKEFDNNNKEKKLDIDDKFDLIAKNMTKDIMNLGCFDDEIKSEFKNIQKKENKGLDERTKNIINDMYEKSNIKIKKEKKVKNELLFKDFDIKKKNKNENFVNVDDLQEDFKKEDIELKIDEKKFDEINLNEKNKETKKIDIKTKNTIDSVLEYVLNEMKTSSKVFKRKFSQRNKRAIINEQKEIEIIEEEDKESSTSEICKEKRIRDSSASKYFFNDSLRESCKSKSFIENSLKEEKNLNNEEKELKEISIKEDNKIIEDKNQIEKEKLIEKDINIKLENKINIQQDNNKDNNEIKIKNHKDNKIETKNNLKQNVIQININNNKSKLKENSENTDMNSSNNDNITISNSNSITENNSLDIENFELEYAKQKDINIKEKIISDNKNIDINIRSKIPKDNKINKKNISEMKLETPKNVIFKNVLNRNKINNININTIKTKNIIIINNNIINNNTKLNIKKEVKSNNTKEPEDRKKPKDNKNKKNINDKNIKVQSNKSITDNLIIKQGFLNIESKNKNIEKSNSNNQQKNEKNQDENSNRSFSDADQFNLLINSKKGNNYIKQDNNNKINSFINPKINSLNTIIIYKIFY